MSEILTEMNSEVLDPILLLDQFFELWIQKDLQTLRLATQQGFSKLSEPLEALLTILEHCPGKQKGRSHTLGYHILMDFQAWMKEHPQVNLSSLPGQKVLALQQQALDLLTDTQPAFVDALISIYQLKSLDPTILRLHIMNMQDVSCYKEAAILAMKLEIQQELNMEKMCGPLILLDKLSLAESFVSGHSQLEQQLITLLDSWCHPSFSVDRINKVFPGLTRSKQNTSQIHPKVLTKHVLRLMEKFKVDPALCPNALHKRRLDTLRYLMYKTFVEKGMTEENWIDHVQNVVADDVELQVHLVELLAKYCGLRKASQWSLRYNIPKNRLPHGVWETQKNLPPSLQQIVPDDSTNSEEWLPCNADKFYQVPLTKDKVHFVNTPEALQRCGSTVLKKGGVVGMDMEWQPTFGCTSAQQVALMQLAVKDHVFLLDFCAREFCQHPGTFSFIRTFFSDPDILKLGYGMSGDLRCLRATWHLLSEEALKTEGMLDLCTVHQKACVLDTGLYSLVPHKKHVGKSLVNHSYDETQQLYVLKPKFDSTIMEVNSQIQKSWIQSGPKVVLVGENATEKGLSLLVQQVLGRPLDKREQMSNWERRPLRISQIRYAVTDAYCLLDVYSILSGNPARFGLPADLSSLSSNKPETNRDKKQKEKQKKKTKEKFDQKECQGASRVSPPHSGTEKGLLCGEKPSEDSPPLPPQQLRVVCDNMLQGLGRYLRCLGVDVVMLESSDDHRVAAKLAQAEGRVILTCGQPFQSLRSQVGEGRCLPLDCSEKARDQAIRVLRHFNIQPTPSDIFSRCQACNSDQYVAVPRADMVRMLTEKGYLQDHENSYSTREKSCQVEDDTLTPDVTPEPPRYASQCRWASLSGLDRDTLTFPGGSPIQLHTVPPALLQRILLFYVCTRCGKVFWEGSHFDRVRSMFQEVLCVTDEDSVSPEVPLEAPLLN